LARIRANAAWIFPRPGPILPTRCTIEEEATRRVRSASTRTWMFPTRRPNHEEMLTPLTFVGNEAALVEAVRAGHPGAATALYDRYARQVRTMLLSTVGPDDEIPDLLHEVFIRALERIHTLREVDKLASWLAAIAVFVGRAHISQRRRRSWLRLFSPERTQTWQLEQPPSDVRRALRETYAILDRLPIDARMAFVLRYVHGMSLPDAAAACQISLSTFKRRLNRATEHFLKVARTRPALVQRLQDGTRWNQQNQT
jgi:RNA polymerase sigma-70 factor (ECF subfamily)